MAGFVSLWQAIAGTLSEGDSSAGYGDTELEPDAPGSDEVQGDLREMLARAREEGLQEGRQQAETALAPVRTELEKEREQLREAAAEFLSARERELQSVRQDVADVVLLMARRVVGDALALHPDALRKVVLDAISGVPGDEPVTVKVSVEDVQRVEGWLESMPRFRVKPDPAVQGGCHVESRYGYVEATTEQAFLALTAATRAWVDEG